ARRLAPSATTGDYFTPKPDLKRVQQIFIDRSVIRNTRLQRRAIRPRRNNPRRFKLFLYLVIGKRFFKYLGKFAGYSLGRACWREQSKPAFKGIARDGIANQ